MSTGFTKRDIVKKVLERDLKARPSKLNIQNWKASVLDVLFELQSDLFKSKGYTLNEIQFHSSLKVKRDVENFSRRTQEKWYRFRHDLKRMLKDEFFNKPWSEYSIGLFESGCDQDTPMPQVKKKRKTVSEVLSFPETFGRSTEYIRAKYRDRDFGPGEIENQDTNPIQPESPKKDENVPVYWYSYSRLTLLPWDCQLDPTNARVLDIPFSDVPIRCLGKRRVTSTNEAKKWKDWNGEVRIEMTHSAWNGEYGENDKEKLIVQKTDLPEKSLVWRQKVR